MRIGLSTLFRKYKFETLRLCIYFYVFGNVSCGEGRFPIFRVAMPCLFRSTPPRRNFSTPIPPTRARRALFPRRGRGSFLVEFAGGCRPRHPCTAPGGLLADGRFPVPGDLPRRPGSSCGLRCRKGRLCLAAGNSVPCESSKSPFTFPFLCVIMWRDTGKRWKGGGSCPTTTPKPQSRRHSSVC